MAILSNHQFTYWTIVVYYLSFFHFSTFQIISTENLQGFNINKLTIKTIQDNKINIFKSQIAMLGGGFVEAYQINIQITSGLRKQ